MRKNKINLVTEKDMSVYYPEFLKMTRDSYFTGYFQTEKYFADIREILLKDFSLKRSVNDENLQMLEQIYNVNAVSLHVRRGDYLLAKNMSVLGVCSLDYYKNAIELCSIAFFIYSYIFLPSSVNLWASFPMVVVFPTPFTPTNNSTVGPFSA